MQPFELLLVENLPPLFVFKGQPAERADNKITKHYLLKANKHFHVYKQTPAIIKLSWKSGLTKYGASILIWIQREEMFIMDDAIMH